MIESFKSTLDEVREADILVHVVDISHPNFEEQYEVVNATIAEIEETSKAKPSIVVFNKVDAYNPKPEEIGFHPNGKKFALAELKKTWMAKLNSDYCIFISAHEKINIDAFKEVLYNETKAIFQVRYPYHNFLY